MANKTMHHTVIGADTFELIDEAGREETSQLKNALTAVEIVDSASGAIASFADGSDGLPVKGLTVQIEPIQAGSGDPSPTNIRPISGRTEVTVTRTGFNVWDEEWELGGINSSTGAPLEATDRIRSKNFCSCMPSTVYYGFDGSASSGMAMYIWFYDAEKSFISGTGIGNTTVTTPSNARYFKLSTYGGGYTTYKNDISINYPSTDHDYHAYQGQTVTIQLGQTVYGGTLDVTNGTLTVDMAMVDLGSLKYNYSSTNVRFSALLTGIKPVNVAVSPNILSSTYKAVTGTYFDSHTDESMIIRVDNAAQQIYLRNLTYNDATTFKTAMSGVQLCYELATPITVQLTAQQITTLLGHNNVWSDADSVSVDYVADTKLYIAKVIADALS